MYCDVFALLCGQVTLKNYSGSLELVEVATEAETAVAGTVAAEIVAAAAQKQ